MFTVDWPALSIVVAASSELGTNDRLASRIDHAV
jgi:hypothetical protein